jgi:hypothetical protein
VLRGITITILFYLAGLTQVCFATVNLSVNPVDGSNSLRFESMPVAGVENKQQIHIRISSPNGDRFQVFQRILEPIVNEKGEALNLQAIETQTLSNSNSAGTLYLQNSDHMSMSDQLLYSSSQGGSSDSFIIGYSLDHSLINSGGNFRGRLIFTVRGMGNADSDQVTIDVFLQNITSSLKISVKGAHDPSRLHIKGSDITERSADYVNVSFSGNLGQGIRIYQEVEGLPQNEMDQELGEDVLQLDTEGNSEGLHGGLGPLRVNKTLIYSSDKDEDNFVIYFLVNTSQIQQQQAGTYMGKIKYIVETDQGNQEFPFDMQIDVPPVFTMNVTTPPGGVSFTHVLANSAPQDEEVSVEVVTNLHKPYQVLQDLQTGMTNQQGKEFDSKYFTLQVEIPSGQRGQTDFVEYSPMQTGEYPVFSSDASGSGATFKVLYRLQGYDQMSPGNFLAPIRLSLDQK